MKIIAAIFDFYSWGENETCIVGVSDSQIEGEGGGEVSLSCPLPTVHTNFESNMAGWKNDHDLVTLILPIKTHALQANHPHSQFPFSSRLLGKIM